MRVVVVGCLFNSSNASEWARSTLLILGPYPQPYPNMERLHHFYYQQSHFPSQDHEHSSVPSVPRHACWCCSGKLEQRADYKRSSEFKKIERANGLDPVETYFTRGDRDIAPMKNPPNKEDVHHDSLKKLEELRSKTDQEETLDAETIAE